jgi:glycosyltransferase involved in cell wall biosynthesis
MINGAISVIIPAYNRAGLIGETLRSLLNQTVPAQEIIVVDDGSTDSTAEAAEAEFSVFSRQYQLTCGPSRSARLSGKGKLPEFKAIRQENAGPGAARNRGFAESKGEFIHFFDSDDIAAPNKHEVQMRALQQSGADIAYGPWVKGHIVASEKLKEENAEPKPKAKMAPRQKLKPATSHPSPVTWRFVPEGHVLQQKGLPEGDLIKELLTRWSVVPHACMFRRSIVDKVGGFPTELFGTEDQMMFLRCLLNGARVMHTPDTIEFYRLGDLSKITATGAAQQRHAKEWAKFLASARRECLKTGIDPIKWEGFRRRIWSAEKDLVEFGLARSFEGSEKLPELNSFQRLRSKVVSKGERMWGGLSQRLTGNRQNSSFRCGRLTPAQAARFPTS